MNTYYMQQNNVVVVRQGNLLDMILGMFFVWRSGLSRDAVFPDESFDWSDSIGVIVRTATRSDFSLFAIESIDIQQSCVVLPGLLIDQVLAQLTTDPDVMRFWFAEHGHAAFTEFDEEDLEEIRESAASDAVARRMRTGLGQEDFPVNAIVGIVDFLTKDSIEPVPSWLTELIDNSYSAHQRSKAAEVAFLISRYKSEVGLPPDSMDPYQS